MKTNSLLVEYIKNFLTPKPEEKEMIKLRYEELSKMLEGKNFQSGSYARFTAVSPVSDLDIIWELPHNLISTRFPEIESVAKTIGASDIDVSDILKSLAERLDKEYQATGEKVRIVPQNHSVGICFGPTDDDFSMDIVPAIPLSAKNEFGENLYYVPELLKMSKTKRRKSYETNKEIGWIKTDPRGYILDAQAVNEKNESFRRVTKFIKCWKNACKAKSTDFKFKSFHLEQIVREKIVNNGDIDCFKCIGLVFSELLSDYSKPRFRDRAGNGRFIDEYLDKLSSSERAQTESDIKNVQQLALRLKEETDETEFKNLMNLIFAKNETANVASLKKAERTSSAFSRPYSG